MKVNNDYRIVRENIIRDMNQTNHDRVQFREILSSQHLKITEQQLQQYLVDIDQAGERLKKSRSFQDLVRYKQLIQRFMQTAVEFGLEMKKSPARNRMLKLVETVDQKLVELTDEVLHKEKDNLRILALIGEIKGLLINLYT